MQRATAKLVSPFAHASSAVAAQFRPPPLRDLSTVPDPAAVRMQAKLAREKAQLAAAKAARIEWERMQREAR